MKNKNTTRLNFSEESSRNNTNPRTYSNINRDSYNQDTDQGRRYQRNEREKQQRSSNQRYSEDSREQRSSSRNNPRNNPNIKSNNVESKPVKDATSSKDSYITYLSKSVIGLEEVYNITEVKDKSILEVFNKVVKDLNTTNKVLRNSKNVQSSSYVGHIQIIGNTLEYFRVAKVNFQAVTNLQTLVNTLQLYLHDAKDVANRNKKLNAILVLIQEMESTTLNYHSKNAYRLLRIFCIMEMYGNYIEGSVIARFIIVQIQLAIEGGNLR